MKNILIMNAVPTNNGDAALVFSIYDKFKEKGNNVTIETYDYERVVELYSDRKFIKSLLDNKYVRKLKVINLMLIPLLLFLKYNTYKKFDTIVGAPGGYINSYYGFFYKLYLMWLIKLIFEAKMIMYSQSVGPLNSKDKFLLKIFINKFDVFMVRDEVSFNNVKELGAKNIIKTNDAAFNLNIINAKEHKEKRVAVSVRDWKHDNRNNEKYEILIKTIVEEFINDGYKVEFISTCQGLTKYVDDSVTAAKIYSLLDEKIKDKVCVNSQYYSLMDLREYLTKFDCVVGTRLHMCILSIMSSVPAFNISYEMKGKECYRYLGLSEYSVDYNEDNQLARKKIRNFINSLIELNQYINKISNEMHIEAQKYLDLI